MNDRFKFRCFSRKTKKMYEVDSLHLDSKNEWVWVHYYNPIYDKDLKIQIETPNAVIMQCTGLKDKNGKLIYEGDILGGTYGNLYVHYCDNCKQFQLKANDYGCMACEGDIHWCELVEDENENELEVIGNIYENKELLECQK